MSFLKKLQRENSVVAATSTPWGVAQDVTKIAPGLTWYSTPGHGGLCVSMGVAQKKLSAKARAKAIKYAGAYWFEEDLAYALPLYENLDWIPLFNKHGFTLDENHIKSTVQRWFPQYLEGPEPTEVMPFNKLKVGDLIFVDRPDGEPFRILQIEPTKLRIERSGQVFRLGKAAYFSRVKKVEPKGSKVESAADVPKVVGKLPLSEVDTLKKPQDIGAAGTGLDLGNGCILVNHSNLMFAVYKKGQFRILDTRRNAPLSGLIERACKALS